MIEATKVSRRVQVNTSFFERSYGKAYALLGFLTVFLSAATATAAVGSVEPSKEISLRQALSSSSDTIIYRQRPSTGKGFSLVSSFFSGRLSGNDPSPSRSLSGLGVLGDFSADRTAELEGDQRLYALLIDGTYDFNYDFGTGLPIHPYVGGGVGMALYEPRSTPLRMSETRDGDTVPLFRVGGGIVYRLGADWDLSLNYKAGLTGGTTQNDTIFTNRSQESVDMQLVDMGMKFKF